MILPLLLALATPDVEVATAAAGASVGNTVDHLVHFHVLDAGPGGALIVDFMLEAVDENTTRVKESVEAVLPAPLGVLTPDDVERKAREQSIALYLGDLAKALRVPSSRRLR